MEKKLKVACIGIVITVVIIILFISSGLLHNTPITDQDKERSLSAFDNSASYAKGKILVAFNEDVSSIEASLILLKYGLIAEKYDESLDTTWINVPEGKERDYAELLLNDPAIYAVEPNRYTRANDLNIQPI